MKTSALTGRALDWAVTVAVGGSPTMRHDYLRTKAARNNRPQEELDWHLSTQPNGPITVTEEGVTVPVPYYRLDWAQGGPIIEREGIELVQGNDVYFPKGNENGDYYEKLWIASLNNGEKFHGPTPLIAAMRCYAASKLGGEIETPEELTKT